MSQMIMKVQIGPVQEFIAQARSTRDMWAGSYLLAWLTASAMKVFKEAGCEFIFPTLDGQPLYEMFTTGQGTPEGLIPTLPNVFMLLVDEEKVKDLANEAKIALKKELQSIGDACWKEMLKLGSDENWKTRWDDQLDRFPIFNWHAVPTTVIWQNDIEILGQQFAARRNTREFDQWNGIAGATKDALSGKEESIGSENFWKNEFWKKAGPFGAMNCIKRLFPHAYLRKIFEDQKIFKSEMKMIDTRSLADDEENQGSPYIAVIAMDGDNMGAALKEIKKQNDHTDFSETLARFSKEEVGKILSKKNDQLVYAGGDDVLLMCPADRALDIAEKLAKQFKITMGGKMTASCGIAVGHYQFPLQRIVDEARKAETRAKNKRGRAAFALTLLKRSGEIIHWGAKWESKALDVYKDFSGKTETGIFSGRFPYALAELLAPYRLSDLRKGDPRDRPISKETLIAIIQKEFEHVQTQQVLQKGSVVDDATDYLNSLAEKDLEDFPNLFLASAFMNRQRGEN